MSTKSKLDHWEAAIRNVRRFVGGEIEYVSSNTIRRGLIREIRLEEEYLTLLLAWTASSPNRTQRSWRLAPNDSQQFRFWLPSDHLSLPRRKGRRINFNLWSDGITLYPKNDKDRLDPNRVAGL